MKIIVLSDTHIPERAKDIPEEVYAQIKGADLLIHAGDITSLEFFKKLSKLKKEIKAVQGNMDEPALKDILPAKQLIKIAGFSIGIIHGWGSPFGLIEAAEKEFQKEKPNIIIFGHSHKPFNEYRGKTLFFNPGSPTDKIFSPINSYGIITINGKIEAKIVNV
mgnify:FL=1